MGLNPTPQKVSGKYNEIFRVLRFEKHELVKETKRTPKDVHHRGDEIHHHHQQQQQQPVGHMAKRSTGGGGGGVKPG